MAMPIPPLCKPVLALVATLAVTGCGGSHSKVDDWEQATRNVNHALSDSEGLESVKIPVLRAPGLERVWGKPKIELDGQGGYRLSYRDPRQPFTQLMIYGMSKPLPKLSQPPQLSGEEMVNDELTGFLRPQEWRQVSVLGQPVRWYQESTAGGADGAYYSTEGFRLKAPDGRKGWYRLVAEFGEDPDSVARWFGSVTFGQE